MSNEKPGRPELVEGLSFTSSSSPKEKSSASTSSARADLGSVGKAIRDATQRLAATSDTARLDAELLMAHALGVSRSELLVRHMRVEEPPTFAEFAARRERHEPVAYITGRADFYGRDFAVSPDVLIPRPDSETLVEAALELAGDHPRVLDLGTGSGALLLTVLAERSGAGGVGIDATPGAVSVAVRNADRLHLAGRAEFYERDWNAQDWQAGLGTFDLILCNPPYVESGAVLDPQVRDHEPASALFAGEDGLDDYRVLIPQLQSLMRADAIAIFEIGATQSPAVAALAEQAGYSCKTRRDLANRPRCAVLRA